MLMYEIKEIFKEAQVKNYPEYVLDYDLKKCIAEHLKEIYSDFEEELRWAEESSSEEAYEDGKNDGYGDGYNDGKYEAKEDLIRKLINEIIKLKENIRDNSSLTHKEIQILITEMLINIDDEEILTHTGMEDRINSIDM